MDDHFTVFLAEQVQTGRYGSASVVVRAGLRLLEEREVKLAELRALIVDGEASGFIEVEDIDAFFEGLISDAAA